MIRRFKFLIYSIVLFAATRRVKKREKSILIVKTDEIGDYVLWRNLASYIRNAPRFKGYSFVLCGNQAWKKITENYDSDIFDDYIWLNKKSFKTKMSYRYSFLRQINKRGFSIVINPIFSRGLRPDDSIVIAASAPLNIGMKANEINIEKFEKGYDKKLYQEFIELSTENIFDFYRNKRFAEELIKEQITDVRFGFNKSLFKRPAGLPENYFIVFPGSNSPLRIWDTKNFVEVASFVYTTYNYHTVVCGSPSDLPYINNFIDSYPFPCTHFIEENGLKDFLAALNFAKLIVSIDTGAVHLAAAVQCPVYGIFNGSQYKRFAPYPVEIHPQFHAIYPGQIIREINESDTIPEKYRYLSHVNFNEVSASDVIDSIKSNTTIVQN